MASPAPDDSPLLLIVDDDPEMRAMLRDVLAGAGFSTEEAADTEALLALIPRVEPAAIILDHEMPGDWGLEILPSLRQRWPAIPVVIITAFGGPKARETAARLGAAAYLDKPFRVADLVTIVRRLARTLAADGARENA
jgi:CheY-like chemotaxis protein